MAEKAKTNKETGDQKRKNIFETLSKIDVSKYVDKKKGKKPLSYLSWANAWGLVKKYYPQANYSIAEFPEYIRTQNGWVPTGRNVDYRQTDAGYEVEATVEIEGEHYSSKLFVMDNRYNAIRTNVSYFDINKTQQRALVKALAFAGLGLNIYAGEDLQDDQEKNNSVKQGYSTNASQKYVAPKKLTTDELKKYTVTINGIDGLLLSVFKNAVNGKSSATKWLAEKHDPQTNMAINQLKSYYIAMENDKKKKKAEEERKKELASATAKIENSNNFTSDSQSSANIFDTSEDNGDTGAITEEPETEQSKETEDVFTALSKFAE